MEPTGQNEQLPSPAPPKSGQQEERREQQQYESTFRPLSAGDIVPGTVVQIDEQGALVDVGVKSEGLIPASEARTAKGESGEPLAVGDRIDVYVVRPESDEGQAILSKKKADYENVWRRVTEAFERGEVVSAMVTDRVKGGLVVDLGLRGFLPASHVVAKNVYALDRFVGQSVRLKILEVDRARKRVVVSQRLAVDDERQRRREKTLESLEEGQIRKGIVRRLTDYGAFIDLGGVDGLLHVTEMSWTRVRHPSDVVKPGQRIEVMVLKFDSEQQKVSLGLRQILPDPWQHVHENFHVGDVVEGVVTRLVPFGAFVMLAGGIEGIIPTTELSEQRIARPEDAVSVEQRVRVKILSMRPQERRMTLSRRQAEQEAERQEYQRYMSSRAESGRITLGDLVGGALRAEEVQAAPRTAADAQAADQPEAEAGEQAGDSEQQGDQEAQQGQSCSSSDSPAESPAEKAQSPDSSL
jgi:4-hydroxy-3-methylbut-2-enyl diphosphate reductase